MPRQTDDVMRFGQAQHASIPEVFSMPDIARWHLRISETSNTDRNWLSRFQVAVNPTCQAPRAFFVIRIIHAIKRETMLLSVVDRFLGDGVNGIWPNRL